MENDTCLWQSETNKRGFFRMKRNAVIFLTAVSLILQTSGVDAHTGTGVAGGFVSGIQHPIFGLDHLVAMVAVGLWGAFLGRPAIWVLPIIFPLVMAFGGVFGIAGVPLPGVELWIAASAIVLGVCVLLSLNPPLWVAGIIVGAFAIFHGHAHGAELPEAANPLSYALGFMIATGLLHLAGIAFGMLATQPAGRVAVRGAGAVIAVVGLAFLTGYA